LHYIAAIQQAASRVYCCNSWQIKLQMQNAALPQTHWEIYRRKEIVSLNICDGFFNKMRIDSNPSPLWRAVTSNLTKCH